MTLKRGLLGITMRQQPSRMHDATPPTIGTVSPGSAAEKAGLKPGDIIKEIDGKPIVSQAQLQQLLGPRYEGDVVALKIQRGKDEIKIDKLVLEGAIASYPQSFLGILPMRDDPEPGVEVRYVYPGSPADKAGLKAGDRIMKIGREVPPAPVRLQAIAGRDQFLDALESVIPGLELSFEVKRGKGKKTETLKVKLTEVPETVPTKKQLPENASVKKALTKPKGVGPKRPAPPKKEEKKEPKKDDKKAEVGFLKRTTAAADHTYWLYVPENYDPNIAHAVLVWLHPPGKNKEKDFDNFWQSWQFPCEDYHIILVCPKAESERGGWTQSEAEFVQEAVKAVSDSYTVDRRRIIAHGMDQGGEMAFYLGFRSRGLFRGVATTGAALGRQSAREGGQSAVELLPRRRRQGSAARRRQGNQNQVERQEISGDLPRGQGSGPPVSRWPPRHRHAGRTGALDRFARSFVSDLFWLAATRSGARFVPRSAARRG